MSPENKWLEDVLPTETILFWGHVSFRGCRWRFHYATAGQIPWLMAWQ